MTPLKLAGLAVIFACIFIAPAYAYVGPGPGLSMLGSLFTLIGGIIVAFFMVLLYPLRLLFKRIKRGKNPEAVKPSADTHD